MTTARYNLGFTAGAFLYRDSVLLSKLYLETKNWQEVKDRVLEQNLLQIRTVNAQKRIFSEAYTRLKTVSEEALEIIANGTREEQEQMIWYAICKKYRFIRDFVVEVLTYKLSLYDTELVEGDFYLFLNNKSLEREELLKITDLTKAKLSKNLFKMLKNMGILTEDNLIKPVLVSPKVKELVKQDTLLYPWIYLSQRLTGDGNYEQN